MRLTRYRPSDSRFAEGIVPNRLVAVRQNRSIMFSRPPSRSTSVFAFLSVLLILKVTVSVVLNYQNYITPNFSSDFLRGRERYFFGAYQWAFYTHIVAGPISLILGLILIGDRFRDRLPSWHRYLGRLQVACVALFVAPSGLWMAYYAAAGPIAAVGLGALAIATELCVLLGARSAVARRFSDHRRWMWRCYLLLCSSVVLRVLGGAATVMGVDAVWFDPLATWMSWLVPLGAFEFRQSRKRQSARVALKRHFVQAAPQTCDSSVH
jgi:hypothetical protein